MPATHEGVEKLPAVSGSSGRLVVAAPHDKGQDRQWPGRVFEDQTRDYSEVMVEFVAASRAQAQSASATETTQAPSLRAQKRAWRQEETQLRDERRVLRQQRDQEDAAWQALKAERQAQKAATSQSSSPERLAHETQWRAFRQQRRTALAQRQADDQAWRQARHAFRQRWAQLPIVTAWIAILVITDNCTRQCLGLPLFVAGPKVTAEMIVEALHTLLPPELLFLITDRGTHFTAAAFQNLMRSEEFIHVLIARHRPQSNGIAERFVRSLKEWLMDKSWHDDQELAALLDRFLAEYNDRPHQGLPIPGLSPAEFANRIWLF